MRYKVLRRSHKGVSSKVDFVLSESLDDQVRRVIEGQTLVASQATSTGITQQGQAKASNTASLQGTPMEPMFPPSTFSGTNSTEIVSVQQKGTGAALRATSLQDNALSGRSTAASGVYGQTDSTFGMAVVGIATPMNGQASGVYGQTVNWVGVAGQATATSGGPAYGVAGDSVSTGGADVAGFEDATSGFTNGVFGQSASTSGTGVFGVATATSGSATGDVGQTASPNGN